MDAIFELIGAIVIIIGVAFSFLGVLGVLRLPDTYTRLHASGKTSTLGVLFLALGVAFLLPSALPKLLALGIFVIFSAPVGSHAIAAAVHRSVATHNREAIEEGKEPVERSGIHHMEQYRQIIENASQQGNS